jgi:hypothetical protein
MQQENMSILKRSSKNLCVLGILGAVLLISAPASADPTPANLRTTTLFSPPMSFGAISDGFIFPGDPLIGLEVVNVRICWDVTVAIGQDAADIRAEASLPINTNSRAPARFILDGPVLEWSGSGSFHHERATDEFNGFFAEAGTGFGSQSWGLDYGTVDILPTSYIEVDYLIPEPSTMTLLTLGGIAVFGKRRKKC